VVPGSPAKSIQRIEGYRSAASLPEPSMVQGGMPNWLLQS